MLELKKQKIKLDNGEELAYIEAGTGKKTILFIHGNMSSCIHFEPVLKRVPKGYKAYAVDLRGFGDSTYNTPINSLYDFAEDIYNFTKLLGIKKLTLAGWSTGGCVCMACAARYPSLCKNLVLIESASYKGYPLTRKVSVFFPIGEIYKSREQMAVSPAITQTAVALRGRNFYYLNFIWRRSIYTVSRPEQEDNNIYIGETLKQRNFLDVSWALCNFNMSGEHNGYVPGDSGVDKITVPVLSFWGDRDIVCTREMVDETVGAIGENAELIVLENCGHSPFIDCPDILSERIYEFCSRIH